MQTKKMTLANIKGALSRAEMKQIMAGSGDSFGCSCNSYTPCSSTCGNRCSSYNGVNTCWFSPFG